MFEGFTHKTIRTSGAEISLTQGGRGVAVVAHPWMSADTCDMAQGRARIG